MPPEPPLPVQMAKLPLEKHGRVVPAFVEYIDGAPDFRVMRGDLLVDAWRFQLCWACGKRRGRTATFVVGPMCAVNRTSAEPPCHFDCAEYSALACPFLSNPNMVRRERGLPEDKFVAGRAILRNPGVTLLWTSRNFKPYNVPKDRGGGFLFDIGDPQSVRFYSRGRTATRAEVLEAIESGLPALRELVESPRELVELDRMVERAMTLVPA